MPLDRETMIEELRKRDCRVIFKKTNGEERDMLCTLQEDDIPEFSVDNNTVKEGKGYSQETIRVVDVDKGEWRSFRIENVISFS